MGTLQEVHQNIKSRYADNEEYAGAIKKDKLILAIMRDNKTWALAQILEVRYKPEPNSDDDDYVADAQRAQSNNDELPAAPSKEQKGEP